MNIGMANKVANIVQRWLPPIKQKPELQNEIFSSFI